MPLLSVDDPLHQGFFVTLRRRYLKTLSGSVYVVALVTARTSDLFDNQADCLRSDSDNSTRFDHRLTASPTSTLTTITDGSHFIQLDSELLSQRDPTQTEEQKRTHAQ
ncbi:unnamed protein product, partial [Arctogadus glacialis]